MNKAQAIYLVELVKIALQNRADYDLFLSRFGTYGLELALEGLEKLRESVK